METKKRMAAYGLAAGVSVAAVALRLVMNGAIADEGPYLTVLPAVLMCGAFLGFGPGVLSAGLGIVGVEWFYGGGTAGAVAAKAFLVFASAAMVAWVGAATRRSVVQVTVQPLPETKPAQVSVSDAVAIAESARRAKERFLGQVSHELRTPVAQSLAILESAPRDGQHEELRSNLQRELRRIDDLLDLTRLTSAKLPVYRRPVKVHELLQEAGRACGEQLRARGQKVTYQLEAGTDLVNGDPARLMQVFSAVLANASRFSPERGVITVSTANVGKRIRVLIEDGGSGIEPHVLAQVFDPFEQGTADKLGGMGIGLSIAKGLVLLHDGSIKVQSDGAGKGTRVETVLPLMDQLPEEPMLFA